MIEVRSLHNPADLIGFCDRLPRPALAGEHVRLAVRLPIQIAEAEDYPDVAMPVVEARVAMAEARGARWHVLLVDDANAGRLFYQEVPSFRFLSARRAS